MKKTDRIEIRVTPEEKMLIASKSKQANLSISEFLIKSSTKVEIVVVKDLTKMTTQLRRIGNNLNQLTKKANSNIITCVDLEDTKKELKAIWQSLSSLTIKLL